MQEINERVIVVRLLLSVLRDNKHSNVAINEELKKHQDIEKQKRAFISRVTIGTIENIYLLDAIINKYSKIKVNKMKPVIRMILRSAVYQLAFMGNIPSSAICDEAVKVAKKFKFDKLKGFVNGVLRNIARDREELSNKENLIENKDNVTERLSLIYSMPEWIIELWLKTYDLDTVTAILKDFHTEKATSIRINTKATTRDELIDILNKENVSVEEVEELPEALLISGYDYLEALDSFRKGLFYVQDISGIYVGEWANPQKDDIIIDVCAAPGGKSIHLGSMLRGSGRVYARDISDYKVKLLTDNIKRSGLNNITAAKQDATILDKASIDKADIVIADLPCSGLGIIGKKPDIKLKVTKEQTEELSKLQREILDIVCQYVKKGKTLLYSTCTINKDENEDNVQRFLMKHSNFKLEKMKQQLPAIDGGDGFFIAKLIREE